MPNRRFAKCTVEQQHRLLEFGGQHGQFAALGVDAQRLEQQLPRRFKLRGGWLDQPIFIGKFAQSHFLSLIHI